MTVMEPTFRSRLPHSLAGPHRLRPYCEADLEPVRALHGRSFAALARTHHTEVQIQAHLASIAAPDYAADLMASHIWLLECGNLLCATAGWIPQPDRPHTARIRKVFVDPQLARRGLALFMVRHVEDAARSAGYPGFFVRANANAVVLYERLGYARIGTGTMPVAGGVELPVVFMERLDRGATALK